MCAEPYRRSSERCPATKTRKRDRTVRHGRMRHTTSTVSLNGCAAHHTHTRTRTARHAPTALPFRDAAPRQRPHPSQRGTATHSGLDLPRRLHRRRRRQHHWGFVHQSPHVAPPCVPHPQLQCLSRHAGRSTMSQAASEAWIARGPRPRQCAPWACGTHAAGWVGGRPGEWACVWSSWGGVSVYCGGRW